MPTAGSAEFPPCTPKSRAIFAAADDCTEDLWATGDDVLDTQMDTAFSRSILTPSRKSQKTIWCRGWDSNPDGPKARGF